MKTIKTARRTLLTFIIATATGSSVASDAIGPGDSDSRWVLGASAVSFNNIYEGEGSEGFIFPNARYNGDRVFIQHGSINLSLGQVDNFSGGLTIRGDGGYLGDSSDYRDNKKLAGLEERKHTLEGGFYLNHTTDLGRLNFIFMDDLGGKHHGQSAAASYTFDLKAGDWNINPTVGAEWISADKVNHYYGVSAAESTATRAIYKGDSATNLFASIRGRYEFTEHWDVELSTGVRYLSSTISDSSIVDADYVYYSSAAVNYNF